MKFYGTVSPDGKTVRWDMPQDRKQWFLDHAGKRIEDSVRLQQTARTERQNNYYWGAVLPKLTEFYNDSRSLIFPVHPTVVHEEMKKSWLGLDDNGQVKKSSRLSSAQFSQMTDAIRNFLALQNVNGKTYYVPSPEEWMKGER